MVATLATFFPAVLADVAKLSADQITDIVRLFSRDLERLLKDKCTELRNALAIETESRGNSKFATFPGGFGMIGDFHKSIYDEIGDPNPLWEPGMRLEFVNNLFSFLTNNYHLMTTPHAEWLAVVEGVLPPTESMGHGRIIKPLIEYLNSAIAIEAGLERAEVISLVLYTGPMFMVLNTILRKWHPDMYNELKAKDSLFPTTIFVLMSGLQKVARVMVLKPGQSVFRGMDGNMDLPEGFYKPDSRGCIGMMETGFMSTTGDIHVAINYTGIATGGKAHPTVIKIIMTSVDRAADISAFSQYPFEKEFLWGPHAFLEPMGVVETIVTNWGLVDVILVRANCNAGADTIEAYEARKLKLHTNSFKVVTQDLQCQLNNVSVTQDRVYV